MCTVNQDGRDADSGPFERTLINSREGVLGALPFHSFLPCTLQAMQFWSGKEQ